MRLGWPLMLVGMIGCGPPDRNGLPDGAATDTPVGSDAPVNICKVQDDGNALPTCTEVAPPGSFTPSIKWTWTGETEPYSIVTPLVANLTDDNGDGAIDLCDTPDVVVVASTSSGFPQSEGHIYLLDGKTGAQELMIPTLIDATVTPAIGDIDGDGVPDIVTVDANGRLYAFDHTGTPIFGPAGQWNAESTTGSVGWYSGAIALADLDGDGHVEIIGGGTVFDDQGNVLWSVAGDGPWSATTAADLDGDGKLEVVLGASAYHYDGSLYWTTDLVPGYPQVADLDGDGLPEVLLDNQNGLSLIKHDGTIVYRDLRPTNVGPDGTDWIRPATIHDFMGDGHVEYAMSSASQYTLYHPDGSIVWTAPVSDESGIAAGTAFDFLGNGSAEAMYADEEQLFVYDSTGHALLTMPRTSGTLSEYPVVADIDNDGSADIIVVSNQSPEGAPASPTVQVIHDEQDRWIQARRIWNEHTYHVTNVREDGTIPAHEVPSWTKLNTFRTNAQINGAGVCQPVIGRTL
ncbi:MAG TPA: VCBS repeat-containing protein [Kofleriaceae bacterium]|jgi:hypothetical protein